MRLINKTEWRTVALVMMCYLLLGLFLMNPMGAALWVQMLGLIPLITLHSSLQHECMHGHPFTSEFLNDALVCLPVGLFLPYFRFKSAHMRHHENSVTGDPSQDPETWYQDLNTWSKRPKWQQTLFELNNTLAGRMLLGPSLSMFAFLTHEFSQKDRKINLIWSLHFFVVFLMSILLLEVTRIPLWSYLVCCYFGYSLLMVRTFLEHQAHETVSGRTVIVEDKGFFSYLFLNNNLHVVHHEKPGLAWYQLPAAFRKDREKFLALNDGYYFKNYTEIFKLYFLSRKESVVYPFAFDEKPREAGDHD